MSKLGAQKKRVNDSEELVALRAEVESLRAERDDARTELGDERALCDQLRRDLAEAHAALAVRAKAPAPAPPANNLASFLDDGDMSLLP